MILTRSGRQVNIPNSMGGMMTRANGGITSIGTTLAFISGRACSDTLFHVLNRAFDNPMKIEEKASMPFAGGIMQHGYQCGMIWGAALAAGVKALRLFGPGSQAETMAILASQKIVDSFRSRKNTINCLEITELDKSSTTMEQIIFFIVKGGTIGCFRMAAGYAPVAYREINAAFSEEQTKAPSMPVSCAAVVARKMGASEERSGSCRRDRPLRWRLRSIGSRDMDHGNQQPKRTGWQNGL